jgi:hypothetical protein
MKRSNQDLRSSICKIHYSPASECSVIDVPGQNWVQVIASWEQLDYLSAELKEEEPIKGEMINQEINIRILGKSAEIDKQLNDIVENPVILSQENSGVLPGTNLRSKRTSAEKAKILQSF